MLYKIRIFLCGMAMGAADLIPGISGGTVAFILGFYDKLLSSLKSIRTSLPFLLPLVSGLSCSLLFLAGFLDFILKDVTLRPLLYSLFSGLILGSALFLSRQIRWRFKEFLTFSLSLIISFFLTTYPFPESKNVYSVLIDLPHAAANYKEGWLLNVSEPALEAMLAKKFIHPQTPIKKEHLLTTPQELSLKPSLPTLDLKAFGAGMIAISAMLLPGISGSYLLSLMGMYELAIASLAELKINLFTLTFSKEPFFFLLSLGLGILAGILLFSKTVTWLLKTYPALTFASLTGFMLGSIKTLYPFYTYTYAYNPLKLTLDLIPVEPALPTHYLLPLLLFLAGILLVLQAEKFTKFERDYQDDLSK